jgi:hypothetical protein
MAKIDLNRLKTSDVRKFASILEDRIAKLHEEIRDIPDDIYHSSDGHLISKSIYMNIELVQGELNKINEHIESDPFPFLPD